MARANTRILEPAGLWGSLGVEFIVTVFIVTVTATSPLT